MVVGAGLASPGLFLRALWLCQHHRARNCDVRSFSSGGSCRRRATISCSAVAGLLFQPGRVVNPLWNHSGADLFRRRLRETTNLVDIGAACFSGNDSDLGHLRIQLVETSETWVNIRLMAGYSKTPLVKKLGIKAGQSVAVVNAPKNFLVKELQPLPKNVTMASAIALKQLDFIMLFVDSARTLQKELPKLKRRLASDGILWVSWPKKSSGVETDLSFDVVQQSGLKIGLVDVKICAVSDIWSGLKFVYRLKDR